MLVALAIFLCFQAASAIDGPIVGILTVPPSDGYCLTASGKSLHTIGGGSCINELYVQFVESAGGRAAPIFYDSSDEQLTRTFNSVNGILFTGGEVQIFDPDSSKEAKQYMHAASLLFNLTIAGNEAGIYMPLWGTCMGLQTLSILAAGDASVLETSAYDTDNISLPLNLSEEARTSRLLGVDNVPPKILRWLQSESITSNMHHDGVRPETFKMNSRLSSFFSVLSTNEDRQGRTFVSTIEARFYPVYGVQWHPERPIFSWDEEGSAINHSTHAVQAMQYFANFLISESRKNTHSFKSPDEQNRALIYNYVPVGRTSYRFYVFPAQSEFSARKRTVDTQLERPIIEQQVTWFYAKSLENASLFLSQVLGLAMVQKQDACNIYHAAPEHFLGVCSSRPPPENVPPVTYTIVVSSRSLVDQWHSFLASKGQDKVIVTDPSYVPSINIYAFNFYDPDKTSSLGYYRFEVQTFENQWPKPTCPPVESDVSSSLQKLHTFTV